jgi:hypothetical protein
MKIKPMLLPPLVVILFFAAIVAGKSWELPTMQFKFAESGESRNVSMIIKGLKCRGTSNYFVKRLKDEPGFLSVSTYVQEHRAVLKYDPSQIDVARIREIIEAPATLKDGRVVQPFTVEEVRE